jgi:hypothetical protein
MRDEAEQVSVRDLPATSQPRPERLDGLCKRQIVGPEYVIRVTKVGIK